MNFEWDEKKNKLNLGKNHLDFSDDALVFTDQHKTEFPDERFEY